jgi:hypothetical protein
MVEIAPVRLRSADNEIPALARKHGVSYQFTKLDELGKRHVRLAGDDVKLDDTELLRWLWNGLATCRPQTPIACTPLI